MSRKIIWKVCLTLEHTFIFGKILVTFQSCTACFPARQAPQGTRPWHQPSGCFWDAQGFGGDSVVLPGPQVSRDAVTGVVAQGCRHRDAGAGMLLAKVAK